MISVAHIIDVINRNIKMLLFTIIARIKITWWGIKADSGLIIKGNIYFKRLPKSTIKIGKKCCFNSKSNSNLIGINRPCMLSTLSKNAKIIIGDYCGFSGTVIGAFLSITIGNNVRCGANTLITDSDWHTDDPRAGENKPVIIEDNVWLGESVRVLKGVTIGKNSVIGIGSIVTKNIPPNVVAAGNPCKVIRDLHF